MTLTQDKFDVRKAFKPRYSPSSKAFEIVDVPEMRYLMVDGEGNPNSSQHYKQAIEALYTVSYTLKFASKKDLGLDYAVPPLEGLWWADDMRDFVARRKDRWRWTMMIMVPEWIRPAMITAAIDGAGAKKALPSIGLIRHETLREGTSIQIFHVGSYDDEGPVLKRLHEEFMPANKLAFNGKHHEIYLSDARRTEPAKLKTVLRQPVKPQSNP